LFQQRKDFFEEREETKMDLINGERRGVQRFRELAGKKKEIVM